jgi:cytochrome P450 family 103
VNVTPALHLPLVTDKQVAADPHGVFRFWRTTHPVVAHETGTYLVLRFADVERIGRESCARATETAFARLRGVNGGVLFDIFDQGMLTANGQIHRHRRLPFTRLFAARLIAELRPRIRRVAEDLIEAQSAFGRAEFIEDFAAQVPARTISSLLGLPHEDIPEFTRQVYEVTKFITLSVTPDEIVECEAAARELRDYVEHTLGDRRRKPSGDFLSAFVAEADESASMSPAEVVFQIVQLIMGGTDTTRVAITAQVALLLQHSEQWEWVCRDPKLIPGAVAEAMRFEPSVASISRIASEEIEVSGVLLPAGSFLTLSTMSAMRDENIYERPDVFDIRRNFQPRLHPVFGAGAHRCIGEALARAELEESLAVLAARIPQVRLEKPPMITGYTGVRRVDTMYLSWKT